MPSSTPRPSTARARTSRPSRAGRGPAAFYATALWLRAWFDDLAFEIHEVIVEGDLVVVHNTMSGRQTGPAVFYGEDGGVAQVMPATGKPFATTQTHWLRLRDGKVIEHWANRDDQGMAMQLGWIPPSPWFLLKAAMATRGPAVARRPDLATSDGAPGRRRQPALTAASIASYRRPASCTPVAVSLSTMR